VIITRRRFQSRCHEQVDSCHESRVKRFHAATYLGSYYVGDFMGLSTATPLSRSITCLFRESLRKFTYHHIELRAESDPLIPISDPLIPISDPLIPISDPLIPVPGVIIHSRADFSIEN
jgi:hypothetical protein